MFDDNIVISDRNNLVKDSFAGLLKYLKNPRVVGNTIIGITAGISNTINPEFPFHIHFISIIGYNTIIPYRFKSLYHYLFGIAGYTAYAYLPKYLTQEVINELHSLAGKIF